MPLPGYGKTPFAPFINPIPTLSLPLKGRELKCKGAHIAHYHPRIKYGAGSDLHLKGMEMNGNGAFIARPSPLPEKERTIEETISSFLPQRFPCRGGGN